MASKRRQRRLQCGKKHQLTQEQAHDRAVWMQKNHPGERFDAYPCPHGDHFHVGHRTKRSQAAISARRERKNKDR